MVDLMAVTMVLKPAAWRVELMVDAMDENSVDSWAQMTASNQVGRMETQLVVLQADKLENQTVDAMVDKSVVKRESWKAYLMEKKKALQMVERMVPQLDLQSVANSAPNLETMKADQLAVQLAGLMVDWSADKLDK